MNLDSDYENEWETERKKKKKDEKVVFLESKIKLLRESVLRSRDTANALSKSNKKLRVLLSESRDAVEKLEKAVEFYANKENWQYGELSSSQWSDCIKESDLDKDMFGGKLAREVLEEMRGKK